MKTQWTPFSAQTESWEHVWQINCYFVTPSSHWQTLLLVSKWRPLIWQVATSTTGTPYWVESSNQSAKHMAGSQACRRGEKSRPWGLGKTIGTEKKVDLSHFERDERGFWDAALSVSQTAADLLAFSPQPSRGFTVSPKMRKYPVSCVRCVEPKGLVDDSRSLSFFLGTLKSTLFPTLRQTPG